MYDIIKNVILSGRYELAAMLKKIDTIWLQGDLTDDDRADLTSLAQEHADPAKSFAPLQDQIDQMFTRMAALKKRVTKLEGGDPEESEECPEYIQPIGTHDAYRTGDKITYNGQRYICIAPDGVAVVWPPDVMPGYWQLVPNRQTKAPIRGLF